MSRTASRRGRTRWLMIVPLTGLAIIVLGITALEAAGPRVDRIDRVVEGVPPLALADEGPCLRLVDDVAGDDIPATFEPGGRVSSEQVFDCPAAFDEVEVSFVGEVVGDVLDRRGGAWVQVNDDDYALLTGPLTDHRRQAGFNQGMAVWLPDGLHERLGALGNAERRGDVVLVRGRLLRTDPNDGEGITIRAEQLQVLAASEEVVAPLHTLQAIVAGVLLVLALASAAWSRSVRRR